MDTSLAGGHYNQIVDSIAPHGADPPVAAPSGASQTQRPNSIIQPRSQRLLILLSSFWRLKGFGPEDPGEDQSRKAITIDPKWRVFDDNRLRHHMILVRSTTEGCGICNILSRDKQSVAV